MWQPGELEMQLRCSGDAARCGEVRGLCRAPVHSVASLSPSLLRRREWAEHCAHEEALFEQHDFAGHGRRSRVSSGELGRSRLISPCLAGHRSRGDLAGTASHVKHHRALLASMDAAVQSCEEGAECSRGGCCAPGLVSDESVRSEITRDEPR